MPDVLYSKVEEHIQHYGVKGMQWGVRRTASQLARRATGKTEEADLSTDAKAAKTVKAKIRKKGVGSLTNAELKAFNERANLEQQYSKLSAHTKSEGEKLVGNILKEVGSNVAKQYIGNKIKKKLGLKVKD